MFNCCVETHQLLQGDIRFVWAFQKSCWILTGLGGNEHQKICQEHTTFGACCQVSVSTARVPIPNYLTSQRVCCAFIHMCTRLAQKFISTRQNAHLCCQPQHTNILHCKEKLSTGKRRFLLQISLCRPKLSEKFEFIFL